MSCEKTLPELLPKLRTRLPPSPPPPTATCLNPQRHGHWPDSQPRRASILLFPLLCAVHAKACSIVCRTAPGYTSADLRLVCSCRELSSNKANPNRQSRLSNTHTVHLAFEYFSALPAPLLTPQRHLYPTHEGRVHEISFAQFLAEPEEDDDMGDAKSATSTTSSGKRKRTAGPAFYAVRVGRTPGVYYSWADCEAQIRGTTAECEL